MTAAALLTALLISAVAACTSPLDCGLNGLCVDTVCACDSPWAGPSCTSLPFKVSPASGKNLYLTSDPRNTWNGPITRAADGTFHIFTPLYATGSLGRVLTTLHGVATSVTGPYDWASQPALNLTSINPALVVYPSAAGENVFSLWLGGRVLVASSPYGPFDAVRNFTYPGQNPAPIYFKGAFYMTNQFTTTIWTTPSVAPGSTWAVFSTISHAQANYPPYDYHVEDPCASRACHCLSRMPLPPPARDGRAVARRAARSYCDPNDPERSPAHTSPNTPTRSHVD